MVDSGQEEKLAIAELLVCQEMPELPEHPVQRENKVHEEEWDEVALEEITVSRDQQETREREEIGEVPALAENPEEVASEELQVHLEKMVDPEDLEHPVDVESPELLV